MKPAGKRKASGKKGRGGYLQNPTHLRAILTGLVLLVGYAGVYSPLSADIDDSGRKLAAAAKRLELVHEVEHLRHQYKNFKDRVPEKSDTNEWVQYVLGGVRSFPLKMVVLAPDVMREIGPYKVVVLKIEIQGDLRDLNDFLKWLETNERLVRVDMVRVQPPRKEDEMLIMNLTVLGIMG